MTELSVKGSTGMTRKPQMSYRKVKDKYVFHKKGVFFSVTEDELSELKMLIRDIDSGAMEFYREDARREPTNSLSETQTSIINDTATIKIYGGAIGGGMSTLGAFYNENLKDIE